MQHQDSTIVSFYALQMVDYQSSQAQKSKWTHELLQKLFNMCMWMYWQVQYLEICIKLSVYIA